ncbi:MAG: hypothetical protein HQ536_03810 [Parcubacteria group bacterium]|nr:hypothetical protein [Parcubacteria group bacterium]
MIDNKFKITEISHQIRELFNNSTIKKTQVYSRKQNGDWNQFCAALDTLEDTCLAIENFQKDPNDLFIKNPYLSTYGFLQALFIQQDAVNFLKISLFGDSNRINWKDKKYSELFKIRQVRNETVGHPVKKENKGGKSKYENDEITSCTINRSSLSKDGFRYMLWMHSKTESKTINFSDIISQQDKHLGNELGMVMKEIQKEEKQHKTKFKNEKLSDLLNEPSLYQINLIYGVQWNDHLAWPSFNHYHKLYKKIRKSLEDRYGKFGETLGIPGTEEVIKKLNYVFCKIETFKNTGNFENYELEIYIDALDAGINDLKTHLVEVDQEFKIQ